MKKFIIKFAGAFVLVLLATVSVKAQRTIPGDTHSAVAQAAKVTYTISLSGLNEQKAGWLKELEKEEAVETVTTNVAAGTCTITVFHPEVMTQDKVKATLENHLVYRAKSAGTK